MDMKRILQAMDSVATKPVAGVSDMTKFLKVVTEGANPHKVSLPVQMAMQHYQQQESAPIVERKPTLLNKFFQEVEQEQIEEQIQKRQLINQYASVIAERVLMKEAANPAQQAAIAIAKKKKKNVSEDEIPGHTMGFKPGPGSPGLQSSVVETPLDFDKDQPTASTIHSHQGVNPASIEARIMRARGQLRELAQKAESSDLIVWESISNHFPELSMNIEQIRHGINELAKIRKQGGRRSHNIPKEIGEGNGIKEANAKKRTLKNSNPCWDGYKPVGTKKKNGKTVPNCVPKK